MLPLLAACTPTVCGPGTTESDHTCLADPVDVGSDGDTDTDTDSDTDTDTDSDTDTDTDADTDTGTPEPVLEVYLLAGQSNMDGYAWYPGLTPSQQLPDPRVPLYWSGWGEFRDLQPASSGGNVYVGPEVTFGRGLADAGRTVALVKHAVPGTDLATFWYPGATPDDATAGEGFVGLADSIDAATATLDAAGRPWVWAGFVWMQGESDAIDSTWADAYEANLTGLVGAVRTLTDTPDLPVVVGLISRESLWTYADTVRAAEQAVADADPDIYTVETDDLPRNTLDLAHYDGVSMRVLGARFARAVLDEADIPAGDDAPQAAVTITGGRNDYDFQGTCGWEFTIDAPITVTDVGNYGATYLGTSSEVGIWDADGDLVLRANVPAWLEAPAIWRSGVWYVAVEPVTLPPGTYRLGVVSWSGDSDHYLNDATGSFAAGIGYSAAVYAPGNWLLYPSYSVASATINFVGPDFLFVPG
jgi:hypothetical protein